MSEEQRRRILRSVAEGALSPAEAAEALDALSDDESGVAGPGLSRVRIDASARVVRVVGDPQVREVVAAGPHELRRTGDTMIVTSHADEGGEGGFFSSGPGWHLRAGFGGGPAVLTVRMSPDLALDADLTAGSLDVSDVRGPIRVDTAAATVRITGFAAPLQVDASAGRIQARGVLDRGASHVRCQAGRVDLELERGSSVAVSGRATVGRVVLPGDGPHPGGRRRLVGDDRRTVVGAGTGTLDVEVSTGTAVVRTAGS